MNYDPLADDYSRHRRIHEGVFRRLAEHSTKVGVERILEVGCGPGAYTRALVEAGFRCYGLDPSPEMLSRWVGASPDGRVRGLAESLPIRDGSVDLIFSVDVIHHLHDTTAYFCEARRALRPGGGVCTVTDSESIIRARRPLSSHFPETVAVELDRYPPVERLLAEMEQVGFERLEEYEVGASYFCSDIGPYRDRAFSSLHLIDDEAFARGLARLQTDLSRGPVQAGSGYVMLWGYNRSPR